MNLLTVAQEGKPTKYYLDGRNVTRENYEHRLAMAQLKGRKLHCFHTKIRKLKGNIERVYNYASV